MNKNIHVATLPKETKAEIEDQLFLHFYQNEGLTLEEAKPYIDIALNSRLSDLEEIINVNSIA